MNPGSRWEIKSRIAFQSLRTITLVWGITTPPTGQASIFYWMERVTGNGLQLYLEGSANGVMLKARWSIAGSPLDASSSSPLQGNGPFYTRITFEATNSTLPTIIRIATIPMSINDITRLDAPTNQIIISPTNAMLFNRYIQDQTMAGFMGLGSLPGVQTNNIALTIGFLHIFDYVVDSERAQTDIKGAWKRKFIY